MSQGHYTCDSCGRPWREHPGCEPMCRSSRRWHAEAVILAQWIMKHSEYEQHFAGDTPSCPYCLKTDRQGHAETCENPNIRRRAAEVLRRHNTQKHRDWCDG